MSRDDEIDWHTWKRRAPRKKNAPRTIIEDLHGRVSCPTLINILLAFDPTLTIDDLQSQLDHKLGMTPTRIALYSLRQSFFRHLELLREAGLLIERTPRAAYIGDDVTPMSDSGSNPVTNENAPQSPWEASQTAVLTLACSL
jgi:hypothetical protein